MAVAVQPADGTVHAATVVHGAIVAAFDEQIPYVHALVELDEAIRVVSMVIDCPPEVVRPGLPWPPSSISHPTKPTDRAVRSSCSDPVHRIAARTDPEMPEAA